jgi:hypothetical protein
MIQHLSIVILPRLPKGWPRVIAVDRNPGRSLESKLKGAYPPRPPHIFEVGGAPGSCVVAPQDSQRYAIFNASLAITN